MSSQLTPKELTSLEVFADRAAEQCSTAFSKWLGSSVEVSTDRVEIIPFSRVISASGRVDESAVALCMNVEEGIHGTMLLLMGESEALELVDMLLRRSPGVASGLGELEQSALAETINVIGCAYLNSLASNAGVRVTPGPPVVIHDLVQSVLQSVLVDQAQYQDSAVDIHMRFGTAGRELKWKLFFLPRFDSLKKVLP